jgi:hypothetical protein
MARGCYGCFGPVAGANTPALTGRLTDLGMPSLRIHQVFRTFNATTEPFRSESEAHDPQA